MENNLQPYVLEETNDFAVVYKPPKMHCVPLKQKDGGTLLEWYASFSSPVCNLVHRLDYETRGLVLIAKNPNSYNFFKSLQDRGEFVKEYCAICDDKAAVPAGFPPPAALNKNEPSPDKPVVIESFFRPFGPGRKQVRPVIEEGKKRREIAKDRGGYYRTEIICIKENIFTVRIKRGFRHQIRCHLCWIGRPIQNDPLYHASEEAPVSGELALCARALFFNDPSSGKPLEYRVLESFTLEKMPL